MTRRHLIAIASGAFRPMSAADSLEMRKIQVQCMGSKVRLISPDIKGPVELRSVGGSLFEAELMLDVRPNCYRYKLEVDGKLMADRSNPLVMANGEKPEPGNMLWHPQALHDDWIGNRIPRGQLQRLMVRCKTPRPHDRQVWIHVPRGYERRTKGLPALYLLHPGGGSGFDTALGWRAPEVADWLIAKRRVKPFVLVMPDLSVPLGYTDSSPNQPTGPAESEADRGTERDPWVVNHVRLVGESAKSLREEVIPVIEDQYSLDSSIGGRAIAGVSGGGTHALLLEAQTKGYAHLLSAAVMHNGVMNELFFREIDSRPASSARPKVIAIAGENDRFRNVEFTREFARQAEQRGMLIELTIHNFGHSGGPRFLVQSMEAAYGNKSEKK